MPHEVEQENGDVPDIQSPLSNEDFQGLNEFVDPLSQSNDYGIDLYVSTLEYVISHTIATS